MTWIVFSKDRPALQSHHTLPLCTVRRREVTWTALPGCSENQTRESHINPTSEMTDERGAPPDASMTTAVNERDCKNAFGRVYVDATSWCTMVLWRMTSDHWICYSSRHDRVICFCCFDTSSCLYLLMCLNVSCHNYSKGGTLRFSPLFV